MRSIYRENAKGIFVITCLYLLQGQAQNQRSISNDIFENSQVTPTSVFQNAKSATSTLMTDIGDGLFELLGST